MKLVFLYGPPGVGKLTVAKELSKLTGYKLFHNHLTSDVVRSILPHGTKEGENLVNKYRLELIEVAAKKKIDVIFIFLYAKSQSDDGFIKKVVRRVKKNRGKVCFVQLTCSKKELMRRIKNPTRKDFAKIRELKILEELMKRHDVVSPVSYPGNFVIDNTTMSPKKVAIRIKKHFDL